MVWLTAVGGRPTSEVLSTRTLLAGGGGFEVCEGKGATAVGILAREVRERGEKELGFVLSQKCRKFLQGPAL